MPFFEPLTNKVAIQLGDDSFIDASGELHSVPENHVVPNLGKNLYSPGQATNLA